jgi:hypothetical protein
VNPLAWLNARIDRKLDGHITAALSDQRAISRDPCPRCGRTPWHYDCRGAA